MAQTPEGTKLELILAAGELFAEFGLEGASVRAIVEKTGANIAAVNYHFGTKEHLYTETLRYVLLQGHGLRPSALLEQQERFAAPGGVALVIHQMVKELFAAYYSSAQPRWYGRLVLRSFLHPSPSLQEVVHQVFEPDHEAIKAIFRRARPGMSDAETDLWAFDLMGRVGTYELCRTPILMILGKEDYEQSFLDAAAEHVARSLLTQLGLAPPAAMGESVRMENKEI